MLNMKNHKRHVGKLFLYIQELQSIQNLQQDIQNLHYSTLCKNKCILVPLLIITMIQVNKLQK